VHDFKGTGNKIDKSEYKKVIEKYKRRIERFYKWCSFSEKALFVIFINSEESFPDIYIIKEIIHHHFSQLQFDILVICLRTEKMSEIKIMDDNIYLAYIYHDESNWPKSDLHWKEVLNHFSIDFSPKTIDLSEVSYLEGDRISFKNTEITDRFVYLGLSHPEPHGTWSIGDKTRIGLRLKIKSEKMTIKCFSYSLSLTV